MAVVEKAVAAERLIGAAITMVERGDDPLAAHLVATSALNILRDLIRKTNQEYVTEVFKRGMFTLANARAAGEPINLDIPPQAAAQIDELAEAIAAGAVTGPDDLGVAHEKPWELLEYIVRPSNFLKHADRDPLATLDEAHFDPVGAIAHALAAYAMVRPDHPISEQIKAFMDQHGIA
jgi:hypothetical protein